MAQLRSTTIDFALLPDYKWDAKLGRYRYASGAAKGRLAPRTAVLSLTEAFVDKQQQELQRLGDRLTKGAIDLRTFQTRAAETLRTIHVGSMILGKGGSDRVSSAEWLSVARTLKTQYYAGIDTNGRRFGLKHLCNELNTGAISSAQFQARLAMYAKSGKLSYYAADRNSAADAGKSQAKRKLASSDRACPDCVGYAALGWQPLTAIVLPGVGCRCRSNCRCELEYR